MCPIKPNSEKCRKTLRISFGQRPRRDSGLSARRPCWHSRTCKIQVRRAWPLYPCSTTIKGITSEGGITRRSRPLARHPLWDSRSRKSGQSKHHVRKTEFSCQRRRCLPPSSSCLLKGPKRLPGLLFLRKNGPGQSPSNADNSLCAYEVPRGDHSRRRGVTVPRALRCTRRGAPGRLSSAAPSCRGSPAPRGACC